MARAGVAVVAIADPVGRSIEREAPKQTLGDIDLKIILPPVASKVQRPGFVIGADRHRNPFGNREPRLLLGSAYGPESC